MALLPNQKTPSLSLMTVGGGSFDLETMSPQAFTMLVFYRGLHCPICKTYLRDLDSKLDQFTAAGVEPVAISCDPEDRATQSRREWEIEKLPFVYGLTIDQARQWGLYVSKAIRETELPIFAEPGVFLIRPDQTLYAASIQTMPFARPHFDEVLSAISFITQTNYPARGEA